MYKILFAAITLLVVSSIWYTRPIDVKTPAESEKIPVDSFISSAIDIKASFAIFTNGTPRSFTASMYHNLSEDVYIEASKPNIVHVKKTGVTWGDFFTTLPFKLTSECLVTGTKQTFCTGSKGTLKFYLNEKKSENMLTQEIKDGDKLLVTFGTESDEQLRYQLNKVP